MVVREPRRCQWMVEELSERVVVERWRQSNARVSTSWWAMAPASSRLELDMAPRGFVAETNWRMMAGGNAARQRIGGCGA